MRSKIFIGAATTLAALFLGTAPAWADSGPSSVPGIGSVTNLQSSGASSTQCNKTRNGGTINGNVQVPNNGVCILNGVTVTGSVAVGTNGYFESNGSRISGNVFGSQSLTLYVWNHSVVGGNVASFRTPQVFVYDSSVGQNVAAVGGAAPGYGHFQVCGSTVKREIGAAFMGPDILVGDPAAGCGANTVQQGDIILAVNNADNELFVNGNNVQNGDIGVWSNSGVGPGQVTGNSASNGDLFCDSNSTGSFTGGPNGSVGDVSGPQCSATPITGIDNDDEE